MALFMLLSDSYPLEKLQSVFSTNDSLLLIGDGVYQLPFLIGFEQVNVRQQDLQQRGLNAANFNNINCISDEQWVELTLKHKPVVSLK